MSDTKQLSTPLPTRRLLTTSLACLAMAAAGWTLITLIGPWPGSVTLQGLLALGITTLVSAAGLLLIQPWRTRPILAWGTLLIALSMGRVVATLGTCLLLYFAARLPAGPLLLGALTGLILVLIGETTVTASVFRKMSR